MSDKTKEIEVPGIGNVIIKKLNVRDWEIIRDECLIIDPATNTESYKSGRFIKYMIILGVSSGNNLFKTTYPVSMVISDRMVKERVNEYYKLDIARDDLDKLFLEIKNFNEIDESNVDEIKKK